MFKHYVGWVFVGFGFVGGVLSILSVGIFLLVAAAFVAGRLLGVRHARSSIAGVMTGMGIPLLMIAFLNREGPGVVCTTTATTQTCGEHWNPWPWLGFGLMLIVMGVGEFVWCRRLADEAPSSEIVS